MDDPFDLNRFLRAQDQVMASVLKELAAGRKRSHWMWFVFPQIAGLGLSATSRKYAISGIDEARAYLEHAVLGERLRECTHLVMNIEGRSTYEIFGTPDDMKFGSSMTLFDALSDGEEIFGLALEKYYDGERDARTLEILEGLASE